MMAAHVSNGSPKVSRRPTPSPSLAHDKVSADVGLAKVTHKTLLAGAVDDSNPQCHSSAKRNDHISIEPNKTLDSILARLCVNDSRPHLNPPAQQLLTANPEHLDEILTNLNDRHKVLKQQERDLKTGMISTGQNPASKSALSDGRSPSDSLAAETSLKSNGHDQSNQNASSDLLRMKQALEIAHEVIKRQELEISDSRNLNHTLEQAMSSASDEDGLYQPKSSHRAAYHRSQNNLNVNARPFKLHSGGCWSTGSDSRTDLNTKFGHPVVNTRSDVTNMHPQSGHMQSIGTNLAIGLPSPTYASPNDCKIPPMGFHRFQGGQTSPMDLNMVSPCSFPGSRDIAYGVGERLSADVASGSQFPFTQRKINQLRSTSTLCDPLSPALHNGVVLPLLNTNFQNAYSNHNMVAPITPLSPDFVQNPNHALGSALELNSQTYITPLEPMNYRRLLDKSVSCDWKYIVDKIVCNNDQQASIFLQQKLKVGTAEQKFEIVEAIVNQAYPLMINRFGNFLVQRCFEHGTPDQVVSIANAIHGNVISLSMDPFGCHVIQKAFDSVPEDHKADMVRELLRRIPETVIHRYACHVWQKLFELRWSGEPPQIMLKVNDALKGMWHEVALGETGSLVVQNIFENCVEEEKRPAIEEVIRNINLIAHGQFGNWCIQHLCEHGSPPDRRRVIDHILANAYSYSIDQFASKVVEKCLKIGGAEFLERYLAVITTARPDRPRIPLIDIAGDQYGNYLVQWVLLNTHQHQREQVAVHIRKHMVSLRGSKFGSRVAMLCTNPAAATRPGHSSAIVDSYGGGGPQARNNWARFR